MRVNIVHPGADQLSYEIREIVEVANTLKNLGVPIVWENIGDPVAKGERVPEWIRTIISDEIAKDDAIFGYSPTRGVAATREFLVSERNARGGVQITTDDILFFNGLGDAIATIYSNLNPYARIIGPNPAYPTHSSAEAAHAGSTHPTYTLDPKNGWLPDLDDLYNKVRYNPSIAGIIIINPDNPTGMVYPRDVLKRIVAIAREFRLFIISDEIYGHLVYGKQPFISLADVLDGVPGIAMHGLSKEVPWPGARCGWIEVYNAKSDPNFSRYARSLNDAKMLQVCATTLPQTVLPKILGNPLYKKHLRERANAYGKKAEIAAKMFSTVHGIIAPVPSGAFYYSVVFNEKTLNNYQTLPISDKRVYDVIEQMTGKVSPDKRFVYYLMAKTGICVVPLTGFNTNLEGFRMTLLEPDVKIFTERVRIIVENIRAYLDSAR